MNTVVNTKHLVVFGLDCAEPSLVFRTLADHMPVCRQLAASGFAARMRSTDPPVTIPAWMSMLTGKDPGYLGCYGIRNRRNYGYESLTPATSDDILEPKVWDVLGRFGLKSIIAGVPQTFPVKQMDGVCIAGIPAPDTGGFFTWPENLKRDILTSFPDYRIDIADFRSMTPAELIDQVTVMTKTHFSTFRHLLKTHAWDFAMMVEIALDRLHHAFWHYWDQNHTLYPGETAFESVIPDYYSLLDREIGRTLAELPPDTGVLIVSDHGAQPMKGGLRINQWLAQNGWLRLKTTQSRELPLSPALVEWNKTMAWGEGGYFGRIFLNVADREPDGIIRASDYSIVRARLANEIESMLGPDHRLLGNRVIYPESHYSVVNGIPPDLITYFGNLAWRSLGGVGPNQDCGDGIFTRRNDRGPDGANHDIWGICIGNFPTGKLSPSNNTFKADSLAINDRGNDERKSTEKIPEDDAAITALSDRPIQCTFSHPGHCTITDFPSIVYDFYNIEASYPMIISS
ncbi:alkaline phosphatase family protein [bacterium]|nr:alkaline phosphatase family protein [candidate division CSSED10-310 bacterium]